MSIAAKSPRVSDVKDVRDFIQGMLIELAEMAEAIEERDLASKLRNMVWSPDALKRFSRPATP